MGTAEQRSRSRARVNQINQLGFVNPRKDPSAAAPRICVSPRCARLARPVTRETLSVTSFWQAPRLRNHLQSQACRIPSNSLGVFLGLSARRSEREKRTAQSKINGGWQTNGEGESHLSIPPPGADRCVFDATHSTSGFPHVKTKQFMIGQCVWHQASGQNRLVKYTCWSIAKELRARLG